MMYAVVERFVSVQGEGVHTGKPAIFIRLAGCNLACPFCDTDHTERFRTTEEELAEWCVVQIPELVVLTGGEPLMQDVTPLCVALHQRGLSIELETNGTLPLLPGLVDWVSLSPKVRRARCQLTWCTSLKLLYPWLPGCTPEEWGSFKVNGARYVQPIDRVEGSMQGALREVLSRRGWRLGVQTHKLLGVK